MSRSVEPALVDLDDLCDACRIRVTEHVPRNRGWTDRVGTAVGILLFLWLLFATLGIVTFAFLRLAGLM